MSLSDIKIVKPKPLTKDLFLEFGDVIEANDQVKSYSINDGHTQRYYDLAKIDEANDDGKTLVNIFRSTPLELPIVLQSIERHPLSSQAFIPLGNESYLVVVAPAGEFNEAAIEVFISTANQGVNYHSGTWHHYCLALNEPSDFIVIDRGGNGENCDIVNLNNPLKIDLSGIEK